VNRTASSSSLRFFFSHSSAMDTSFFITSYSMKFECSWSILIFTIPLAGCFQCYSVERKEKIAHWLGVKESTFVPPFFQHFLFFSFLFEFFIVIFA